jgi:predicted 3-demethylubiquinone-9 3-methyltransferase (glyoxalase superfamily)
MRVCLWFDGQAEEAARFYTSVFRGGSIGSADKYTEEFEEVSGQKAGSVMTVPFEVEGQKFLGLNGGPQFKFTEAVSFMVERDTQEEIDELWDALTADGGEESMCGWLKDRFGVSWQIIPAQMNQLLSGGGDAERARRVGEAMLKMRKLDIAALQRAYDGETAKV